MIYYYVSSLGMECVRFYSYVWRHICTVECFVRENVVSSPSYEVTSGVPHGSVLGPLLYSAFPSDVHKTITNCQSLQYADGIWIFRDSQFKRLPEASD